MAATVRSSKHDDLVEGTPFDLGAASGVRSRSRVPELLIGTLMVAVFALAGAWFHSTSTARIGYVALRQDVARGEVIEQADLTVYELATDAPIQAIRASDAGRVVGMVARADLGVGTLVSDDLVAGTVGIPQGSGVVGLDLAPGESPSRALRAGDRVRVVLLPDGGGGSTDSVVVIAESAEVVDVVDVGGRGRFVALGLEAGLADRVAAGHARDRIRLIQVSEG